MIAQVIDVEIAIDRRSKGNSSAKASLQIYWIKGDYFTLGGDIDSEYVQIGSPAAANFEGFRSRLGKLSIVVDRPA